MFSMLRGLSAIRLNIEDVMIQHFHQPIITDVNITLDTVEDRLTDVMRICAIREGNFDKCIPTDYAYFELLHRRMRLSGTSHDSKSVLRKVMDEGGKITLEDFQSLCAVLDIYRGGKNCTGWSSKTFRSAVNVSNNE